MMYIAALGCLFAAMKCGNFITFIMTALFAYVLIESAFTMEGKGEEEKED